MLTLIILLLCAPVLLLLATVVVYSNYQAAANRWLGAFIISGLLWLLANSLADLRYQHESEFLLFTRLALIGSSLIPLAFVMFCASFTRHKFSTRTKLLYTLPVVGLLLTVPTPLNIVSVRSADLYVEPGPAYYGMLTILVLYVTIGIIMLVRDYRVSQRLRRQQLYYILLGTVLTVIPGALFNNVLPLMGYSQAASYGPAAVIFFAIFTSLAIIKHRLFDVRLVIARSLAYAGSLLFLGLVYGLLVFGLVRYIFDLTMSVNMQIFLAASTGVAALTFQYLKRIFDGFTNRLFYQDTYEQREIFDPLNRLLVSSLNIDHMMTQSAKILAHVIKADFCTIGVLSETGDYRLFGTQRQKYDQNGVKRVRELATKVHHAVIIADMLEDKHSELKTLLLSADIAVLVRLTENPGKGEEGMGYLMLGVKKSGNPYNSQDEAVLQAVANELVLAIQNALRYEQIQQFNTSLQERIDEATRKLRRTNEKLKALDEAKDDFVSMASHQLRTPLTSIKGYTSMVLEGDAGKINATQRKLLEQSFFSSQRMVYLIADLLNVSRLKTGKFVIESGPVNLADVVDQEVSQLVSTAAARQLELTFTKPESFPTLLLDETKTRQVIMNFIDNAIYYTPTGGHIQVKLIETATAVEFRVVDDGIGVPKSEQPHLFTKFYRAGNARKARPDGTGLGLFMAKKVVVAQGGAIIFATEENKGSTFGFTFPKSKQASVADKR